MRKAIGVALICLLAGSLVLAQAGDSGVAAKPLGQANLRAEASIDSERLGEVRAGAAYPVLGRSQFYPWILLGGPESGLPIGWVFETLLSISGDINRVPYSDQIVSSAVPGAPTGVAAVLTPTAATAGFSVSGEVTGEVNIRYGPGIEYPRVGVAQAGQRFDITGYHTQFPWVRVRFPGVPNQQAWIARDLLDISGNLLDTPAVSRTRLDLPQLTATPPSISVNAVSGGEPTALSAGFQILADHLWRYILESGFDAQTSRFGALFVMDLDSGEAFSFGEEYAFSGTSINKIAILTALYQHLDGPPSIELATDIANTMICSENVATNRLLSIVGGGNSYIGAEAVTGFYQALGWSRSFITAPFTTVGTPEPPPHALLLPQTSADQQKADPDLSNQLTVSEIGALLANIYACAYEESGKLIENFAGTIEARECRQILHVMSNNTVDALLKAGVPVGTRVAHKHGWIADTHGNAAVFFTPGGDYVIAMMLFQPGWLNFQESLPVIAEVSRRVYNYFNPGLPLAEIREGYIPDANSCNFAGDSLALDLTQSVWLE